MTDTRNIVVFYDSPCIDGAASAWAIHEALKQDPNINAEFVPIGYGRPEERTQKILQHLHDGAEAIFVDTSPKDDTLALLFDPASEAPKLKKLTVLDHHASEVERIKKFEKANSDNKSGPDFEFILDKDKPAAALLAWEYFHPGKEAPHLLEWVGKMEPPVRLKTNREYAMAAFIDSKDIIHPDKVFDTISELVKLSDNDMVEQGNAFLADQFNNIQKGIKSSILYAPIELRPGQTEWVPLVNANVQNFGRRVNEALLEEANAGTTCGVSGAWFVQGDGTVKLSLRSKGVPNVEEIARYLGKTIGVGGGGHPTDAVAQFESLAQFSQAIKLCTHEQMLQTRWNHSVGPHTAAVVQRSGNGNSKTPGQSQS